MSQELISDSTDLSLFVRNTVEGQDELSEWNKERIIDALVTEAAAPRALAERVANEVEQIIKNSGMKRASTVLIRELVNSKLLESGHSRMLLEHARFGLSRAEIDKVLYSETKENANVMVSPESIHKYLADAMSKQYALDYLIPVKYNKGYISDAHLRGDIHIHDLDYFISRPYCSGHDLRYIAKYGIHMDDHDRKVSTAMPAKHATVLLLQAAKWLGVTQTCFSGAQAYSMFNTVVAPYLVGKTDKEMKQLAQMFIFEMAQMTVARGAQAVFSDINIDFGVPDMLADAPATGPGGKTVGTYADYYDESVRFARALLEVYGEGDSRGVPFMFPKPLLKIRKENLSDPDFEDYLLLAHQVSAKTGSPYFINQVSYEDENISMCCRLRFKIRPEDVEDVKEGRARSSALQNTTINLPRIAYMANGDDALLLELLRERMKWVKEISMIKHETMERLIKAGSAPLLAMEKDGQPYLRMNKVRYLMGVVGLNELVQAHTGQQMHESTQALQFGWKLMKEMQDECNRFSEDTGYIFAVEQTPAESTSYRFAKLDMKYFNGRAAEVIKGDHASGGVYYTNSTHLNISQPIALQDRIRREGLFHPLIEAGSITHAWLGEASPDPSALAKFTVDMMKNTMNQQFTYTRDITYCEHCGNVTGGMPEKCPKCGSTQLQSYTRVTGYYQNVDGFNRGKQQEVRDRYRNADLLRSFN